MALTRSEYESDLANSMSRHIGYTTGAYQIDRIANITTVFRGTPSLYQYELIQHLISEAVELRQSFGHKYATEIVNFAVALGLLHKVADGPTPAAKRFALTSEGMTIRSALERDENAFLKYTLTGLVLESDCDTYGLLLDILYTEPCTGTALHGVFRDRFESLRRERLDWLNNAFPNRILRVRINEKTSWTQPHQRTRSLSPAFARHHVTPRLGWAQWFGHIESNSDSSTKANGSTISETGVKLIRTLRGSATRYVWLGPRYGTQEALGIPQSLQWRGPWAPSWNLLRPATFRNSEAEIRAVADHVVDFMHSHYIDLKLIHANQASIKSIIPYLHFIEYQLGYSVGRDMVLDKVFGPQSSFSFLSSRRDKYGYFQITRR